MEPASSIIAKLGGPTKVAVIVGIHRVQIHKWTWPNERGGTGGNIPHKYVQTLIDAAPDAGARLSASDFTPVLGQSAATGSTAA